VNRHQYGGADLVAEYAGDVLAAYYIHRPVGIEMPLVANGGMPA
jgi:hypothetical protein